MDKIRTPIPHYFEHGIVSYSMVHEKLHYQIGVWSLDGMNYILNQKVLVPVADFVSNIKNCITLEQIKSQLFSTVSNK